MNFKVGDRVAVYINDRAIGTVVEVLPKELRINVTKFGSTATYDCYAHPKQCRRLKKKEPVTYWVNQYAGGLSCGHLSRALAEENADDDRTALLEFRLVKRHEVGK